MVMTMIIVVESSARMREGEGEDSASDEMP